MASADRVVTAVETAAGTRGLTLVPLIALVIGSMIGGGVFNLPADMSRGASPGAILIGWLITGVGMNPLELAQHTFPAGSMGPKVAAACHFARATGRTAAIGALADIAGIASGDKGTQVDSRFSGITYHG